MTFKIDKKLVKEIAKWCLPPCFNWISEMALRKQREQAEKMMREMAENKSEALACTKS